MKYPLRLEMQGLLIFSDQSSKHSISHNSKISYDTKSFLSLSTSLAISFGKLFLFIAHYVLNSFVWKGEGGASGKHLHISAF